MEITRRTLLAGGAGLACLAGPQALFAADGPRAHILAAALSSRQTHDTRIGRREAFAVVDFGIRSYEPRFFVFSGHDDTLLRATLTAHGKGSDPGAPSALPVSFSNVFKSNASSLGAYVTGKEYPGGHGRSLLLAGLDPTNNNAALRDVVLHSADYVSWQRSRARTPMGRSFGCFVLPATDLGPVIDVLKDGGFLYAGF